MLCRHGFAACLQVEMAWTTGRAWKHLMRSFKPSIQLIFCPLHPFEWHRALVPDTIPILRSDWQLLCCMDHKDISALFATRNETSVYHVVSNNILFRTLASFQTWGQHVVFTCKVLTFRNCLLEVCNACNEESHHPYILVSASIVPSIVWCCCLGIGNFFTMSSYNLLCFT